MEESLRQYYLQTMGVTVWLQRNQPLIVPEVKAGEAKIDHNQSSLKSDEWTQLEQTAKACQQCQLHQSRRNVVFGVGNNQADLMIIGEAPGFYEDQKGEPFVGAAGQLLNKMLAAIGFLRQDIYIANVLKCRPPENRDPTPEEVKQCTPFLEKQVELIKPKILLALGKVSAQYLLGIDSPMYQLRGRLMQFGEQGIPLIVTYHPAYLLRNAKDKAKTYSDLLLAKKVLDS